MTHRRTPPLSWPLLAVSALVAALASAPAAATETASSAASSAGSATVGSVSDSIQASSQSSTGDRQARAGEYRVAAIDAVAGRPGHARIELQPADAGGGAFALQLPVETARRAGLLRGSAVTVREQAHGLEFAAGEPRAAFFLALNDDALRELGTRPL